MNKICMGIWGMTNLRDRFNISGFGEEVAVIDRIKTVGEIQGVDGIELHVPTEIDEKNADEIKRFSRTTTCRWSNCAATPGRKSSTNSVPSAIQVRRCVPPR